MSGSFEFQRWREKHWPGSFADYPSGVYRILSHIRVPSVLTRSGVLWRPDDRFGGDWFVRRHESGGLEISFSAIRHGARPRPPIVIPASGVDKFIVSCITVRGGEWTELTAPEVGVPERADLAEAPLYVEDEERRDPARWRRELARVNPRRALEAIEWALRQLDEPTRHSPADVQRDQPEEERLRWTVEYIRGRVREVLE